MRPDLFADALQLRLERLIDTLDRRRRRDTGRRGLTATQVRLLRALLPTDGVSAGELSAALELAPSTVTRVCDVLVRRGLVARARRGRDRRRVTLGLTDAGFRTAREMDRWDAAATDRLATAVARDRREPMIEALDTLLEALEPGRATAASEPRAPGPGDRRDPGERG